MIFINNNQVKKLIDSLPSVGIRHNPEEYARSLTSSEQRILNILIDYQNKFNVVYPSQSTLARQAGFTRMTVSRAVKKFQKDGILTSVYRHKQSCFYRLTSFFFLPHIRSRLQHLFSSFKYLSLMLLQTAFIVNSSGDNPFYSGHVTLPSNKVIMNNITLYKYRQTRRDMKQFFQLPYGDNPISPTIRSLKCIKLTKWGQIKLSAFPDEAIAAAATRLENASNVRLPFEFFIKACWDYVNLHEITPDWQWSYDLAARFKMPLEPRLVFERGTAPDTESQPSYGPVVKAPKTGTAKPYQQSAYQSRGTERRFDAVKAEENKRILNARAEAIAPRIGNIHETEQEKYDKYKAWADTLDKKSMTYEIAQIWLANGLKNLNLSRT